MRGSDGDGDDNDEIYDFFAPNVPHAGPFLANEESR